MYHNLISEYNQCKIVDPVFILETQYIVVQTLESNKRYVLMYFGYSLDVLHYMIWVFYLYAVQYALTLVGCHLI